MQMWIITALWGITFAAKFSAAAELPAYRLRGEVVPRLYNLSIGIDLDKFEFSGVVDIEILCKETIDEIKLHSVGLTIPDKLVTVTRTADKKREKVISAQVDSDNDFLVIKMAEKLEVGSKYILHISFSGNLSDGLSGLYRSKYDDKTTNSTKWVAVTQFESTDARRAFPCFDEPSFKARFRVSLAHNAKFSAISNMPLDTSRPHETRKGWVWSEFKESVPMSTYLVAFLISDFDYRQSLPESNNVQFRVWARPEAIDQVDFAKTYGPKFLKYYESFFNVSYPLPKQDMVALPDFAAGAMENWGLITYRESQLLLDKNLTTESTKYNIANTIAHELAHQWFGNLVTMKWWTDLWLNEGFATFVAGVAVDREFPAWNAYNFEVASNLMAVLNFDALISSHPVSVPIFRPCEIDQVFDSISYNKGSLLIHMMMSFLGEDVFTNGVSNYIKKFSYGNSEQDDLWNCLTEAAHEAKVMPDGLSVKQIMDTWTLQTGYPVLSVTRNNGTLTVSQKRFLSKRVKSGENVSGRWWVPLTYTTAKHPNFRETRTALWLSPELEEISIDTKSGHDDWILLNNRAAAICRVNYDPHTWSLLAEMLHTEDLSRVDELSRTALVLDAMALAQTGALPYATALRVLKYARRETSYNPWLAVLTTTYNLEALLIRTDQYPQLKKMVRCLLSKIYHRFSDLQEVPQGLEETRLKALIVSQACHFDMEDCVSKAKSLFKQWMTSEINPIPKDLRGIVYCRGVQEGGEEEWTYVWQQYLTSNLASEKNTFLGALACTKQEHLINRYLEWSIDLNSGVRKQDAELVFAAIAARSPSSFLLAWSFLEKNIQRIHDYLQPNTKDLGNYIKVLAQRMVFPEEVEKLKAFVKNHQKLFESSQLLISQGLETAETNLAWMRDFYANISRAMAS